MATAATAIAVCAPVKDAGIDVENAGVECVRTNSRFTPLHITEQ